jgi:putative hydrolase of the HAD superfamily
VAFDLDGTLYPNYRLNIKLVPLILKEWRLFIAFGKARSNIRKEQEKSLLTHSDFYEHQAEITAKNLGVASQPLKERIDILIYKGLEPLFKKVKLFKNVKQTIAAFHEAGLKLGILSDFPPEIKLEHLNLSGFWDAALCSEKYGALKPNPLPFTELARAMSLPCEKILYVGNSLPYDIAGAQRVGMKTAWIKSPLFPRAGKKKPIPDFTFSDYRKLYDYMLN